MVMPPLKCLEALGPADVIAVIFLIYASVVDVLRREIDPVVTALTALTGVVYIVLVRGPQLVESGAGVGFGSGMESGAGAGAGLGIGAVLAEIGLSLLPGFCLTAFGLASRGAIGIGDGLTLLVLGFFLPVGQIVFLSAAAFLLSAIFSAGLLIFKRGRGRTAFPFLPFLLAGEVLGLFLGG